MRTALFLAAKDPAVERTGDMAMFNLVLMLAQEMVAVRLLALGAKPRRNETSTVLEKPEDLPSEAVDAESAERAERRARALRPRLAAACDC